MKKYLAMVAVLIGALLVTSAPASAQIVIGIGHHGVRVGVGVPVYDGYYNGYDNGYYDNGYYTGDICGYDVYNRPIICRPAPQPFYYGGCGYGYCGPVYGRGYYAPRYYNRGDNRGYNGYGRHGNSHYRGHR